MKIETINKIKCAASLSAIVLLLAIGVFAQSNTGSMSGFVKDSNGAAVSNAAVVVTNVGTSETRTVQTDSEGRYEVPSLSTGVYKIVASASGFQETTVNDAKLAVGEKARYDVILSVGQVSGTVVVTADQTKVDTETATVGDTITSARISDTPINGRDFTSLLATVPGSVQSTNQFQTSINGIPSTFGGASVLVDGIDAGRVDLNGTSNVLGRIESRVNRVSLDSIQEIQVVEQNYSAQYGQAISAVINPITKSGTNQFHGGAFDYFRNEALDANDYFNNASGFPRSEFRLNQFGGNVSGRIIKDKLFFFTNYEGVRQTRGSLFRGFVPTAAFRTQFTPAVAPAVATLPLPNTNNFLPGNTNFAEYRAQKDGTLREDTGSIKLDYLYNERSQFSVRYNINDSNTVTPFGVGNDQTANGSLRVQLFKLSNNYTLSSNAVNEFAFGINRNVTRPGAGTSTLPIFNFLFVDPSIAGPGPAQFNQYRTGTVYQFLDSLTFVKGNHSFKAGTDIRLNRREASSETQYTLFFFGANDFASGAALIGQSSGNPLLSYANENYSFFFQDDWKARPRLTLNLGLRYDVSSVSREKQGRLQNFDLATRTFTPLGQKIYNADKNNFGPRVGFAFDVFGNQKTVLRGGYGIFYNQELPASFGSPQANTYPQVQVFFPTFPIVPAEYNSASLDGRTVYIINRNLPTTYAQQYSLNIQQDLKFGVLQVGYVGNHVLNILTNGVITPRNINPTLDAFGTRPIAGIGSIFDVGTYPQSNYNALQVTFKRNLTKGLRYNANYTWSHTIDNVIGFFKDYQNYQDLNSDRASSDQDIRHNFTFDAGYDVPSFRRLFRNDGIPRWIADGWQLNTLTQIRSGFPVNVTVTGGIFGGALRPNVVPGVSPYPSNYSVPNNQFNPAAFSAPAAGTFGNLGRNALRGPGFAQVDFSIFKNTKLTEKTALQLRMEVFNLFNRTNFADPSGGLNVDAFTGSLNRTAFFGQSVSTVGNQLGGLLGAGGPRQIQLSARFIF
ncbi:MAG: carboxypeptidase regulatory-like domain-containing protein [Acidobacteriota bacterium]